MLAGVEGALCVCACVHDYNAHRGILVRECERAVKGEGSLGAQQQQRQQQQLCQCVCVSVCKQACVCEGWMGEERQTRQDSWEKKSGSGSKPSLSPPLQDDQDPRTRLDLLHSLEKLELGTHRGSLSCLEKGFW